MRKIVLLLTLLFGSVIAAGQAEQEQDGEIKSTAAAEAKKDPRAFCYHEDKAYSQGAVLNGMICERLGGSTIFIDGEPNNLNLPLVWKDQNEPIIRTSGQRLFPE